MKGRRRMTRTRWRNGPPPNFVEHLGKALECPELTSNAERIRSMREVFFADVVALQQSGTIKLPE